MTTQTVGFILVTQKVRSKPFDTRKVFLKELFEKVNFEKKSADDNYCMKNFPACKYLISEYLATCDELCMIIINSHQ